MSEFSDFINEYIKKKNINRQELASYCELNSYKFYKLLHISEIEEKPELNKNNLDTFPEKKEIRQKRKILDTPDLVKNISDYLCMTVSDTRRLQSYYDMLKYGKWNYNNYKKVNQFFETVYGIIRAGRKEDHYEIIENPENNSGGINENRILENQIVLNATIHNVIRNELKNQSAEMELIYQPGEHYLQKVLFCLKDYNVRVVQIFCMNQKYQTGEKQEYKNLETINQVISLYYGINHYEPYACRGNISEVQSGFYMAPYLLLTSNEAVTFSESNQEGILITEKNIVDFFHEKFLQKMELSERVFYPYKEEKWKIREKDMVLQCIFTRKNCCMKFCIYGDTDAEMIIEIEGREKQMLYLPYEDIIEQISAFAMLMREYPEMNKKGEFIIKMGKEKHFRTNSMEK